MHAHTVKTYIAYARRPVWSKRHGAYITLVTAWLIALLLSCSLSPLQLLVLLLLLAGFNFAELLTDTFKRKSPQHIRRRVWMWIYGVVTAFCGIVLAYRSPLFLSMLPVFTLGGAVFLALSLNRKHKPILSEILTFGMFALAGLLAYNPAAPVSWEVVHLWVLMTAYFSLSIFQVKFRIGEITIVPVLVYTVSVSVFLLLLNDFSMQAILIAGLLIIKAGMLVCLLGWYRSIRIKTIGFMETGFQVVFVVLMVVR